MSGFPSFRNGWELLLLSVAVIPSLASFVLTGWSVEQQGLPARRRQDIASMDELSCALLLVSRGSRSFFVRLALALVVIGLTEEQIGKMFVGRIREQCHFGRSPSI